MAKVIKHDGGEVDAHRARGFLVLRDGADGEAELGAIEQKLQADDHQRRRRASISTLSSRRLKPPRSIELRGSRAGNGFGLAPCG